LLQKKITTGTFPDFPDTDDGGTAFLFDKSLRESDDHSRKEEKKKDEKKDKKNQEYEGWKPTPSNFTSTLSCDLNDLKTKWVDKVKDFDFMWQAYDIEIIKHEKIIEVWRIMHIQADELMRKELARMIRSLEGKNKKKKDKKKKDKKSKKDKKKNKKDKDPFSNRTIESLWEELVQQRIIIQPNKVRISDLFSDHSYLNAESQKLEGAVPIKCAFEQFLEALYLYGVIPLCSKIVHEDISPY